MRHQLLQCLYIVRGKAWSNNAGNREKMDVKCLVIHHHPIALLGYRFLLESNFLGWQILTAFSLEEVNQRISYSFAGHIDIVVLDLLHPSELSMSLLSQLRDTLPSPPVILVSAVDDSIVSLMREGFGAHVYFLKDNAPTYIISTLRRLGNRQTCFRPSSDTAGEMRSRFPRLTCRQQDLVKLLLLGYSNKAIASTLNISCGTVKNYMFDLMRLLAVRSRLELVAKIHESGLATHS